MSTSEERTNRRSLKRVEDILDDPADPEHRELSELRTQGKKSALFTRILELLDEYRRYERSKLNAPTGDTPRMIKRLLSLGEILADALWDIIEDGYHGDWQTESDLEALLLLEAVKLHHFLRQYNIGLGVERRDQETRFLRKLEPAVKSFAILARRFISTYTPA